MQTKEIVFFVLLNTLPIVHFQKSTSLTAMGFWYSVYQYNSTVFVCIHIYNMQICKTEINLTPSIVKLAMTHDAQGYHQIVFMERALLPYHTFFF
jgi:hypothetical protein